MQRVGVEEELQAVSAALADCELRQDDLRRQRDKLIRSAVEQGLSLRQIARFSGVSSQRAHQISRERDR